MSVKKLTIIGVMAAVMCVLAPWSLQIGTVPITFATLAIYFIGAIIGEKYGTISVVIYILLGLVGLPVFSGFTGGLSRIIGVTGGYIIGYIPCVYVCGVIIKRAVKKFFVYPLAMIVGTIILYIFGTLWYAYQTGNSIAAGLYVCVLPFLPGDVIKIIIASVFSHEFNKRMLLWRVM